MSVNKKLAQAAQQYRDNHHWVPLRLQGKSPDCMGKGWTKRTLANAIPKFEEGDNIGILLGAPSGGIVRLDPDFPSIAGVTAILFPEPTLISGRKSSPRSGRLYDCKDLKSKDFKLPDTVAGDLRLPLHDGKPNLKVFQILSTGKQHVVPPSIHPESGEEIVWENDAPLVTLDAKELLRRVGIEAFCMAVRQFWPARGTRNEAAMALARVLLETLAQRYPDEQERLTVVDELVTAVAMAGGDGEASRKGKQRAAATLEKMKAGEETTGLTRLVALLELPETLQNIFRKWLGLSGALAKIAGALPWRERRTNGMPLPSMHNARMAITAIGVECSYNIFHNKLLFGFKGNTQHEMQFLVGEVTDNGIIRLRQILSDRFGFDLGDQATRDAVISLALEHCFDPVRDTLDKAETDWDGNERLDRMAIDYLNCKNTPLNRAIVRKTMIAAVRRVRDPGCKFDNITILESPEGWNKSTAWRVLAGDENFSDASILGKGAREVQEQLAEVWIHENAELAGMTKADVEVVKTFASRQSDNARPAYGHFLKKQKRHSIEVGSTNSDVYMQSQTGNRRLWPLVVTKSIDIDKLKRDRLQLWGEAAKYESAGEEITLDKKLWSAAAAEQEKRRVKDAWEDILAEMPTHYYRDMYSRIVLLHLTEQEAREEKSSTRIIHRDFDCEVVASIDVLAIVLGIPPGQQHNGHAMRLANVMLRTGWQRPTSARVTINGKQVRGYFRAFAKDDYRSSGDD